MKREVEFRIYLNKNGKPEVYVGYCNKIEEAFSGKDMDEIVSSHQNISKVCDKLHNITSSEKSIDDYMTGLNHYLKFLVYSSTSRVIAASSIVSTHYYVSRAEGVKLTNDVEFVCQVLEQEYDGIIQFAKLLFLEGSFNAVPIIVSEEIPKDETPDGVVNKLGAFFPSTNPYIEIYYRNFKSLNIAAIRNCLAHEYLHYLHYTFAGIEYGKANKALKEGLADFFSVIYSIYRNENGDLGVAQNRYKLWKKYEGTFWPYANALHFYRVNGLEMKYSSKYDECERHGCVDKFIQVFIRTRIPEQAYDTMIK